MGSGRCGAAPARADRAARRARRPLLEREIAHLTGQRVQLEERVLTQLLLVDELIARAQVEEQALASAEHDWAVREAALIAERGRLGEGRRMVGE